MLLEFLIQIACSVFSAALSGLNFINIPIDLVNVLGTICAYGNWVVGADVLLLFAGCLVFWTGVKLSFGVIVYIWKLLPLT